MARPSLLTDERIRGRILEAIRFGVPAAIAAEAAGISERTFHDWVQRGRGAHATRKADQLYVQFAQEVREARARGISNFQLTHAKMALGQVVKREVRRVVLTEDGAHEELVEREYHPPHPGAIQWWLERRVPAYYGAVVAKDAESQDPDEVMPPAAADLDPATAAQELSSILDRYVAAVPAPEGAGGGLPQVGGD